LNLSVVIVVDPEKFDLDNIDESNYKTFDQAKERCPHLRGENVGEYSCSIHHYPWFKDTPCGTHTQFETTDSNCRMGDYFLKKSNMLVKS